MTTRERVRTKTGVAIASDFNSPLGTPLVIDDTTATGQAYFLDAAGNIRTIAVPIESTWTPGLSFGGGTTGITYSSQTGTVSKCVNGVQVTGIIILTSKGSSTGAAKITGLPYSVRNNQDSYVPPSFYIVNITFSGQFQGFADINTTTITLAQCTELGVASSLTDANFANNSQIQFSMFYRSA